MNQNNINQDRQTIAEPNWLEPNFKNIPPDLQKQPWAVWIAEAKLDADGNRTGKWNKAPRCPKTGSNIATNKPYQFGTFQQAQEAYATGKYTGVGVLLTGNGITGFDLDNSRQLTMRRKEIKRWLKSAHEGGAYCEASPSNTGMRLFVFGKLNSKGRKYDSLEIYDDVRFLTVTGRIPLEFQGRSIGNQLPQGQSLIDSFLNLLPNESIPSNSPPYSSRMSGKLDLENIPEEIKRKLPDIFNRSELVGDRYENLFNGDISMYDGDHSAADLSIINYLTKQGLSPLEVDQIFRASGLYRTKWDELRGKQTYGEMTINKALSSMRKEQSAIDLFPSQGDAQHSKFEFKKLVNYKPIYIPNGMAPRRFVGPKISDGIRLFPEKALSSLVALGAVGKTSILLSIACHIAAGKDWNGHPLQQQKVAMFFCEETEEEISRKFSANTENWDVKDREKAESNLITIPLLGVDGRLTSINRNQYQSSDITEKMITLLNEFDIKNGLVILDHMQGFTAGDLNLSETATAICREANKIVDATGAAVVMAAHISKNNIKATDVEQGFAVGSLAFENATRQMSGMIPMPPEDAKKYGLEANRKEYIKLSLAKNSYGATDQALWLKKIVSPKYHTVVFEPVILTKPLPTAKLSEMQKIGLLISNYISKHQYTTRNKLDILSGIKGNLKASKAKVREALDLLIATGGVKVYKVDDEMRKSLGLAKQVNEILRVHKSMAANNTAAPTTNNSSPAAFNPLDDWG